MVSGLLQTQASLEQDPRVAAQLREAVARIRTFVDIHETIYAVGVETAELLDILRQVAATVQSVFAATPAGLLSPACPAGSLPPRLPTSPFSPTS